MLRTCLLVSLFLIGNFILSGQVSQINIQRIELMPNEPSPFNIRDWKQVATGYDSFVYDINRTGQFLPLIFTRDEGTNYPENPSFGLDTYVGTNSDNNGEAINVLPSLVGATLAGVDKTNQYGMNWILMSQDYFNKNNGENLYLNNINGHSGGDWWYDMMPNIYFYQLYDLYGNVGDAQNQFKLIADRMALAVRTMGGSTTPWTKANMDYRAWDFLHMTPNPDGVHEPEAAGAFTWLLFNAYRQNGDRNYLQAAEWSMEYLINLGANPSYELQLPYGAYAAAKMNAEIGTKYNIEKLLFWIFNRGPLRGWGTIVGKWNSNDVSGLVGEANDAGNDYAFQLNGIQQAGQLAPLVRYDKRFARAIGKWMLNVTNATRLMYPGFLPDSHQDSHTWSDIYDPQGVIGYEALREKDAGLDLVSTGDAIKGGWAATNLSLYSTSSIGYLGAIVETTSEEKILKIDLLKTDFFRDTAYPSYLLFNPYTSAKSVTIDVGNTSIDIYDAVSESFLATQVTGPSSIIIPANKAVSIVLAPAGGVITHKNNLMLINGVVVDYLQSAVAYNYPPRVQSFAAKERVVEKGDTLKLYAKGIDQETKDLTYTYIFEGETKSGLEREEEFIAPDVPGTYAVKLFVTDESLQKDSAVITIDVVTEINLFPQIEDLTVSSRYTHPDGSIHISALVTDGNNDPIEYMWSVNGGFISGSGSDVNWAAPHNEGIYTLQLTVNDGRGGSASGSVKLFVYDTDLDLSGDIIAWYPFTGNANDISGHQLNGTVSGAKLTADSLGHVAEAYFFDGVNDHIRVSNDPVLNFTDGITVSLFAQPQMLGDKERFIISHGSYENRWKISVTPDRKVRWTLKNATGAVKDLDSETVLEKDKYYHIAATYNGRFMILYINGSLESFTSFTGPLNASPVDLEIGQRLPDDPAYNFRGVLDEIKILDFAQHPDSVAAESGHMITGIGGDNLSGKIEMNLFPNPALNSLTIEIPSHHPVNPMHTTITIFDTTGHIALRPGVVSGSTQSIDISTLVPGLYFVLVREDGKSVCKKFIVE